MKVLVAGNLGNMGRRYSAIVKYLGHEVVGLDQPEGFSTENIRETFTHAIVAAPTLEHTNAVEDICRRHSNVHILCEKPIDKNPLLVETLYRVVDDNENRLYCVNQYAFLPEQSRFRHGDGETFYDFYNSGKDGLAWDCFQLFALARGPISLNNRSPVWSCAINGHVIKPGNMDFAYVAMVSNFLGDRSRMWDRATVMRATEAAERFTL